MFGALSVPSVSTGFSKNSKAMVPVSIQGMTDKVKKMSPLEGMKEAFFDIRDSIDDLGIIFSEKISGLNEHLAFRFDSLNKTLLKIAGIDEDQLEIDEKTGDIIEENEKDDDKRKSLAPPGSKEGDDEGPGFFGKLKNIFGGMMSFLTPEKDSTKVGLLGLLLGGIIAFMPDIENTLAVIFEWFGESFVPFLKALPDKLDTLFTNFKEMEFSWKGILGTTLAAYVALKIAPLLLGIAFRVPGGAVVLGYAGLAVWAITSVFQAYGDTVGAMEWTKTKGATDSKLANALGGFFGGKIKGGIINAMRNASKFGGLFAATGATIGLIGGPIGVGAGALLGGLIGIVFGGVLGFFGGGKIAKFFSSIGGWVAGKFNDMVKAVKGFFFDEVTVGPGGETTTKRSMLGEVKDVMMADFKLMGESIKDFFYDDEGNLFGINFGALIDMLPSLQDIADKIVSALPEWMRPDSLQEKIDSKKLIIQTEKDRIARSESGVNEYTLQTEYSGKNRSMSKIKRAEEDLAKLENEMKQTFPGFETTTTTIGDNILGDNIINNKRIEEFKKYTAANSVPPSMRGEPASMASVIDASKIVNNNMAPVFANSGIDVDNVSSADRILDNFMSRRNT